MKKPPMRRCLGCNVSKPKKDLLRVVRGTDGNVFIDPTGKSNGRGAYICRNKECLRKAIKTKRFERSLEVTLSEELLNELMDEVEDG